MKEKPSLLSPFGIIKTVFLSLLLTICKKFPCFRNLFANIFFKLKENMYLCN